jgi:hypothetical protein
MRNPQYCLRVQSIRRVGGLCSMAASLVVARQLPASKDVSMEAEEATALEAVTR